MAGDKRPGGRCTADGSPLTSVGQVKSCGAAVRIPPCETVALCGLVRHAHDHQAIDESILSTAIDKKWCGAAASTLPRETAGDANYGGAVNEAPSTATTERKSRGTTVRTSPREAPGGRNCGKDPSVQALLASMAVVNKSRGVAASALSRRTAWEVPIAANPSAFRRLRW